MNTKNLYAGYGREGLRMELAEVARPADLFWVRKVEKEFAQAILADHTWTFWGKYDDEPPAMNVAVVNLAREHTYLDVYASELEKSTQPRGVRITYPNGDGPDSAYRWYRKQWTNTRRTTFESAIDAALRAHARYKEHGDELRAETRAILRIGQKWSHAVALLIEKLEKRLAASDDVAQSSAQLQFEGAA